MKTIVDNNSMMIINSATVRRANVIMRRTGSEFVGVVKSQMIDTLNAKLHGGIAHFVYAKKDGSIREAWGTLASNLMNDKVCSYINRDMQNVVCYFDIEKGAFRSLRFENLIRVF